MLGLPAERANDEVGAIERVSMANYAEDRPAMPLQMMQAAAMSRVVRKPE
jgi:hypothetical protein